jgi:hypothetical protein
MMRSFLSPTTFICFHNTDHGCQQLLQLTPHIPSRASASVPEGPQLQFIAPLFPTPTNFCIFLISSLLVFNPHNFPEELQQGQKYPAPPPKRRNSPRSGLGLLIVKFPNRAAGFLGRVVRLSQRRPIRCPPHRFYPFPIRPPESSGSYTSRDIWQRSRVIGRETWPLSFANKAAHSCSVRFVYCRISRTRNRWLYFPSEVVLRIFIAP